jgi:conjugative relaxase-like TrwC/TraI family protein
MSEFMKGSTGRFMGAQAKARGLSGDVKNRELKALLCGLDPKSGNALVTNAGNRHKAGWDCTFTAPMSVSVAWGVADPKARIKIETAHTAGVRAGIALLERYAFFTNHGQGRNKDLKNAEGGVVAVAFRHSTNRVGESSLHDHVLVANFSVDGRVLHFDTRNVSKANAAYAAEILAVQ